MIEWVRDRWARRRNVRELAAMRARQARQDQRKLADMRNRARHCAYLGATILTGLDVADLVREQKLTGDQIARLCTELAEGFYDHIEERYGPDIIAHVLTNPLA